MKKRKKAIFHSHVWAWQRRDLNEQLMEGAELAPCSRGESSQECWSRSFCWVDASSVAVGCVGMLASVGGGGGVHREDITQPGRWEAMPSSAINYLRCPVQACVIATAGVKRVIQEPEWLEHFQGWWEKLPLESLQKPTVPAPTFQSQLKIGNSGKIMLNVTCLV